MNSGEPRKYIVPMTRIRFGERSEPEKAYYDNDLVGHIFPIHSVEITFTPAPEFIRKPLTAAEQAELARLCEATRGDI